MNQDVQNLLNQGKFNLALPYLQKEYEKTPNDPMLLYNYGMCLNELNRVGESIEILQKAVALQTDSSNILTALGFSYFKSGALEKAKAQFEKAVEVNPLNAHALRNLSGIYGKEGNFAEALKHARLAYFLNPKDMGAAYALGALYFRLQDHHQANVILKALVDTHEHEDGVIIDEAKKILSEIAEANLKEKGFRADAMLFCYEAINNFQKYDTEKIQALTFEISMLGAKGLDINDDTKKFTLKAIAGEYTALQLVCYMYVGWKQIDPNMNTGIDLSAEYKSALELSSH